MIIIGKEDIKSNKTRHVTELDKEDIFMVKGDSDYHLFHWLSEDNNLFILGTIKRIEGILTFHKSSILSPLSKETLLAIADTISDIEAGYID